MSKSKLLAVGMVFMALANLGLGLVAMYLINTLYFPYGFIPLFVTLVCAYNTAIVASAIALGDFNG